MAYKDGGFEGNEEVPSTVQKVVQQPVYEMDILCFIYFRVKSLRKITERILRIGIREIPGLLVFR